jgi:hypothetical protein
MRGSTKSNNTFFYVKIKGLKKEDKKPFFEFQKKDGETYKVEDNQQEISGCIDGPIKIKHYEFEGRDCIEYRVQITDDSCNETYILSLGNSNISRNILNSILSLDTLIEPIKISLYLNKGKDGKEYKQVSVRNNLTDEFIQWKYPIADFNAMVEPIKDKKGVTIKNDTSKLDEFLEKEVVEWGKKFTHAEPKKPTETQVKTDKVNTEIQEMEKEVNDKEDPTPETEEDQDLPF